MKLAAYTWSICCLLILHACNQPDEKARDSGSIDSLSISLNNMSGSLKKIDTMLLEKSITRFRDYRLFITENVRDTILKEQADNLKHFFSGGENLEACSKNLKVLNRRADQINAQLSLLKADLKNGLDHAYFVESIAVEKTETSKLIDAAYKQQELYYQSLEEFKNALNGVEALIKSRNSGELPVIIKDTINL
jgi:hypothetical protein